MRMHLLKGDGTGFGGLFIGGAVLFLELNQCGRLRHQSIGSASNVFCRCLKKLRTPPESRLRNAASQGALGMLPRKHSFPLCFGGIHSSPNDMIIGVRVKLSGCLQVGRSYLGALFFLSNPFQSLLGLLSGR